MLLLTRRLRHLKAISIVNVTLVEKAATAGVDFNSIPCYYIVEDLKGHAHYISEIQVSPGFVCQFNELPPSFSALTRISIKVVGELPRNILKNSANKNETWVVLNSVSIDLNQLQPVDVDQIDFLGDHINMPLLEFTDGYFVACDGLKSDDHFKIDMENKPVSTLVLRKSSNFNSLLKLNKILEFMGQVQRELDDYSAQIEIKLKNRVFSHRQEYEKAIEQVSTESQIKASNVNVLKAKIERVTFGDDEVGGLSGENDDEYGTLYSDFLNRKHFLQAVQARKIDQLSGIFAGLDVLNDRDFGLAILYIDSNTGKSTFDLKVLNAAQMVSIENRERLNAFLGYYLLVVKLLALKVFHVSLPHRLLFYGSTSLVSESLPLYLTKTPRPHHMTGFENAIHCFNLNILQIKQHLERCC
ncbi:LAMI_0C05006g1_1 [Lachancea mirantina]|uniref:LAMI_0C05006g1_1 n=1 Tax=Lachancea mirantina TaxID=1230905 RepID=A0A1G4J2W1_9SACH|nr:LAMI_0C05006g1_1 [Lachancea mirantina]